MANLGTFSLWLDEVFTMTVADQPLGDTLAACAKDAENVPLYAVITHYGLALGGDEVTLRLVPIAAGLASILLLSLWTRRHFGPQVALLTAAFCALSTFHLRYSQELRSYPYLLLVCTLTLVVADRMRRSPDGWSVVALAATVGVGLYTQLIYPLILVPAAGTLLLSGDDDSPTHHQPRRVWARFGLGVALGVVAFTPWIWKISATLVDRMPRPTVTDWSWGLVGSRWQVLTIGSWEYDPLDWFASVLAAIAVIGLVSAVRSRAGRLVLIPSLATIFGWEILMLAIHHWSNSRYNTPQWLFVAILVALGVRQILTWIQWRWLQVAVCLALAAGFGTHIDVYYRVGRPHWDTLAKEVLQARRDGEPVVTTDHWARTCLSYYLGENVPTLQGQPDRLAELLAGSSSVLLVERPWPPLNIAPAIAERTRLADVSRTARLDRVVATRAQGVSESRTGG